MIVRHGCRRQPGNYLFYLGGGRENANGILCPQRKPGAGRPPRIMVRHRNRGAPTCCDSCSCLADICFHPLPCSDASAQRAVEVLVLSSECSTNIAACYCRSMKARRKGLEWKRLPPACLAVALR